MKNKYQVVLQAAPTKKPAKAEISDTEFRRRLKNISEWRKKRLAELRTKDPKFLRLNRPLSCSRQRTS